MSRVLTVCAAVLWALPAAGAPADDPIGELMDSDVGTEERDRFFASAGVDGELSREEFEAAAAKPGSFVRKYEPWRDARAHDADGNGRLNWPEAERYRQAMRKRLLGRFDRNGDGKITGPERDAANAVLGRGLERPRPGVTPQASLKASLSGEAGVEGILRALGDAFQGIELTDAQKSQVRVAHERLAKGVNFDDRKAVYRLRQALIAAIREKVLTEDQRTDVKLQPLLRSLRGLSLTDEQRAAIRDAYRKLAAGQKGRSSWRVMRDLREKVRKEVLTEDQRTAQGTRYVLWRYGRAHLDDGQKAKVRAICARHARGVDLTDRERRDAAMKKIAEEIDRTVLTEKQREAMKRSQSRRRGRGRRGRD